MKTRNTLARLTLCVLSAFTIVDFISLQEVKAESIEAESTKDCRKLVTGTYLTTIPPIANVGLSRGITTYTRDGSFIATSSLQSGVPNIQSPFSTTQGSWKCTSNTEITATGIYFNYSPGTVPNSITRTDFHATFDPKARTVQGTATLTLFDLNANPLKDDGVVLYKFPFTGQPIEPERRCRSSSC